MKTEKDNTMKNMIIGWGMPDVLEEKYEDAILKFDDKGIENTNQEGYHFLDGDVKFCIFIPATGEILFTMEFFEAAPERNHGKNEIWLELIYVHIESLRRKGIASYYMKKLIQYAIIQNMDNITLKAIADAYDFKDDSLINALPQNELEVFYRKFDSPEMHIVVNVPIRYDC